MEHLHKDVNARSYFSGAWISATDVRGFAQALKQYGMNYGYVNKNRIDIVKGGIPVAVVEFHHDTEDIFCDTNHPDARLLLREASHRGYRPAEADFV